MSQNIVIPGKDNKVVFVFGGIDLTLATDIQVQFGSESYTKLLDPLIVVVDSATQLSLNLSATSEVGKIFTTITYIDGASVNGTDITSQELGNSDQIIVAIGTQLIIEDGSTVDNANSYVTDNEYKAYASLKGLSVAATQPEREANLLAAMDYLNNSDYQGTRATKEQLLAFPRHSVWIHGWLFESDQIPQEIKNAQMEGAIYSTGSSLMINAEESNLASFSIPGAISESYHKGGSSVKVRLDRVNAQLEPLLNDPNKLVRT